MIDYNELLKVLDAQILNSCEKGAPKASCLFNFLIKLANDPENTTLQSLVPAAVQEISTQSENFAQLEAIVWHGVIRHWETLLGYVKGLPYRGSDMTISLRLVAPLKLNELSEAHCSRIQSSCGLFCTFVVLLSIIVAGHPKLRNMRLPTRILQDCQLLTKVTREITRCLRPVSTSAPCAIDSSIKSFRRVSQCLLDDFECYSGVWRDAERGAEENSSCSMPTSAMQGDLLWQLLLDIALNNPSEDVPPVQAPEYLKQLRKKSALRRLLQSPSRSFSIRYPTMSLSKSFSVKRKSSEATASVDSVDGFCGSDATAFQSCNTVLKSSMNPPVFTNAQHLLPPAPRIDAKIKLLWLPSMTRSSASIPDKDFFSFMNPLYALQNKPGESGWKRVQLTVSYLAHHKLPGFIQIAPTVGKDSWLTLFRKTVFSSSNIGSEVSQPNFQTRPFSLSLKDALVSPEVGALGCAVKISLVSGYTLIIRVLPSNAAAEAVKAAGELDDYRQRSSQLQETAMLTDIVEAGINCAKVTFR